ncbi:MAG: hypothetical protein KGI72_04980 [Patescibacteria group bacterium]|nr:hypothetical protein [Patescibacteria group bacterium]
MLNTTDLLIKEGEKLAENVHIPSGYIYYGEDSECPKCHTVGLVYADVNPNDAGGLSADLLCHHCGYEWSEI